MTVEPACLDPKPGMSSVDWRVIEGVDIDKGHFSRIMMEKITTL